MIDFRRRDIDADLTAPERAPGLEAVGMDRVEAHRVLTEHLPAKDWRWLGFRSRCVQCGRCYPCASQKAALDVLTARGALRWWE